MDLLERIHHNQELEALSKMSFAIIQTVLRKLEARYERCHHRRCQQNHEIDPLGQGGYYLDVEEVAERERPPMISLPAYQLRKIKFDDDILIP